MLFHRINSVVLLNLMSHTCPVRTIRRHRQLPLACIRCTRLQETMARDREQLPLNTALEYQSARWPPHREVTMKQRLLLRPLLSFPTTVCSLP